MKKNPYHPRVEGKDDRFAGYGWFYVPSWKMSIGAPAKAGSSTLKRFMSESDIDCTYVLQKDVPRSNDIYFVVRNPFARFESLWQSKCRDKGSIKDKDVHGLSPRALVAHISSGKKDVHWTPQADLIRGMENVNLIPLENLNAWWASRGYGELEVVNATDGDMPMNQAIHQWICDYYAEDFILYSKACGFT